MQEIDPAGTPCIAISSSSVMAAVTKLTALPVDQLRLLKVASGEHIAAIITTAFLNVAPEAIDGQGEVDLVFTGVEAGRLPELLVGDLIAIEIKSMRGPYREFNSAIDRDIRRGLDPEGRELSGVVESVDSLILDIESIVNSAAEKMKKKLEKDQKRHVFVIVHPLDRFIMEPIRNVILSPALPKFNDLDSSISAVWVLWVPDRVTTWSSSRKVWVEMIFQGAVDPNEIDAKDSNLALLQEAELQFLAATEYSSDRSSPYLFTICP